MRTKHEIAAARKKLRERIMTPGLGNEQKAMICGMLNALVWVADGPDCTTMERMLSDELLAAGQDPGPALATIEKMTAAAVRNGNCPRCGQPLIRIVQQGQVVSTCTCQR